MLVDARLDVRDLALVAGLSGQIEALGFDGAFAGEAGYDPFLQVGLATEHTSRLQVGTSVAIALARNPLETAQTAHDLQKFSRGRFILGLGTQVRAHIVHRYGSAWERPADRIREFVIALRAIWRCWNEGDPLNFEGDFYRHTLMTPLFNPGPNPYGVPLVFLAAVGPRMCEIAGEVADGVLLHSFVTGRYVRQVLEPAVARGLAKAGRSRDRFQVSCRALLAAGATEAQQAAQENDLRAHLAFYGSTPAYRRVLDVHGWDQLQPELHRLYRDGDHDAASRLITDDILDAFAVRAAPSEVPERLRQRYGPFADRLILPGPYTDTHRDWSRRLGGGSGALEQ